jgi:hypothetical protein
MSVNEAARRDNFRFDRALRPVVSAHMPLAPGVRRVTGRASVVARPHPRRYPAAIMESKKRAAVAAMAYVQSGMVVGLGTGSTSRHFHEALGAAVRDGRLRDVQGVPTSEWAADFAQQQGVRLTTLAQHAQPTSPSTGPTRSTRN